MDNVNRSEASPTRFTDEQAQSILRRAVELHEVRGMEWDENDLIAVAGELGIDQETVRDAIAETKGKQHASLRGHTTRLLESAVLSGFGAATFIPVALWDINALPSIVTAGATSVMLALDSAEPHSARRYLLRNVALWAGFWIGGSTQFFMADPVLFVVMGSPVLGGLASLALMNVARRFRPSVRPPARLALITRVAAGVRSWLETRGSKDNIVDRTAEYIVARHAVT